ncbi:hypothetical protein QFC19_001503 [Naganishia cerealis]|uniref:Uncharacterized protein n=1 Tax=Naganishia cerealis TaxID=610337 RepID=A0ACC2WHJ4_9TREE|nr:hypothetical protein QFC19_001503 [Naganishia cerealis]
MAYPSAPRQRRTQQSRSSDTSDDVTLVEGYSHIANRLPLETFHENTVAAHREQGKERQASYVTAGLVTLAALFMRFHKISHPAQVVFDEVHFGAFAGQYIRREYYFDVHPPLAKMLNALSGWLAGFNGDFNFDNIGDDYLAHNVPYIPMRAFCAIMGALTVPVIYAIMRESGYPILIAAFSASLVLFDNAHITQSQLILLDAALILFISLSLLSYIKFHQLRYREFSAQWWMWLFATGFFLACTLGCKMVGLFTFMTVGAAVLWDLWQIMDIKRGNTMTHVAKHFFARVAGLIVFPLTVYLLIFWVHFRILIYSGPGDTFMSPAFQETLQGNELLMNSQELRYFDTVTMKHKDTKAFLHSHAENYPLRYDDGRISSQGQQVTGYHHNDTNNEWQIIPTHDIPDHGRGRVIRHKDIVQLLHVSTNSYLLTHDVASPLMPTNQEFTTWPKGDDMSRYNDTLFQFDIADAHDGEPLKSKSGHFRLVHVPTRVALWTYTSRLPDWAFNQQEINGNKNLLDKSNIWFVDDILADGTGHDFKNRTGHLEDSPVRHVNFFKKFFELQVLMLQHNAGLTSSHPYASEPFGWPFLLSGISFWTDNETRQQIYLMGNVAGWWICVASMSVWGGIMLADALSRRRGTYPIEDSIRNRMLRNTGFFMIGWACHYFPFFLMNRQRFLHHYLPAHLISALVAGSVLNFVTTEVVNYPISKAGLTTRLRPRVRAKMDLTGTIVTAVLIAIVVAMWYFLSPFTYGFPGLTGEEVNRRKLLSSWSLHFEGKVTHAVDI